MIPTPNVTDSPIPIGSKSIWGRRRYNLGHIVNWLDWAGSNWFWFTSVPVQPSSGSLANRQWKPFWKFVSVLFALFCVERRQTAFCDVPDWFDAVQRGLTWLDVV